MSVTLAAACTAIAPAQSLPMRLPTEWSLRAAPPDEAQVGTFPQSIALTADGRHVVVLEGGAGPPALRILSAQTLQFERAVRLDGAWGKLLPDAAGAGVWAGTGNANTLVHLDASSGAIDRTIALGAGFWPGAIARSPDGAQLAVSGEQSGNVGIVDLRSGALREIPVGRHPAGIAYSPSGRLIYVALWGENNVAVVDLGSLDRTSAFAASLQVSVRRIGVGRHPEALALSPDGRDLYVSLADDDSVARLDAATGAPRATVNVGLFGAAYFGASPSDLAVSGDGSRIYVACGAANAVAVLRRTPDGLESAGALATGWYPSAIALEGTNAILIANAKGDGSYPSPGAALPLALHGSLWRLPVPSDAELTSGAALELLAAPPRLKAAIAAKVATTFAQPAAPDPVLRGGGPIQHVIYVLKEGRTYDQILGDAAGNGDPTLARFGARVTPNEHALAQRFGIYDATYASAQSRADGASWSTAALSNDYTERMWPAAYAGRRAGDFEDGADAAMPRNGYLWNSAARAGLTLRNYGVFTTTVNGVTTSSMPDLRQNTDPDFPGYDLGVTDTERVARWQREFDAYERSGALPALEFVLLANDRGEAGTLPAQNYVADNDAAFGTLVDAVSHSKDWPTTLIVAIETSPGDGPDHVDAQRTTLYAISPYARGGVHHVRHSTAGVVRTIEILLGLAPLTANDAGAQPLYDAFSPEPDLRPYVAAAPALN